MLLSETINITWMYNKWDRFDVVRATYNDKELYDGKEISCRYVDIKSRNTWKIYRVLSK